ncbi:MAG: hypothetical protein E7663_02005 [Ruminococcaceae bacterium]|nr:hypothetical protein [Oscillospiraceae bacterium]
MNNTRLKIICNKTSLLTFTIVIILLFSLVFLWIGDRDSTQAQTPLIAGVSFQGEYRIGDGEWHPVTKSEHIPANNGDVTLRGIFLMHNPETGEVVGPLSVGSTVNLYFNHIGGTVILPNAGKIIFDAENELLGEDACAAMWGSAPSMGETPITIILHNPHDFGNANAIDEFFKNMSIAPGIYLESMMLEQGASQRSIGSLVFIISLIILGISAFATIIHVKYSKAMWLIGLTSFFAGGYFLFDAFAVSFWNDSNIFNTRSLGLCMMFYMLFSSALIVMQLKRKAKTVGAVATAVSATAIFACIALSFSDTVKFYDTWLWWAVAQAAVAVVLILCQSVSLRRSTNTERFFYSLGMAISLAFLADLVATGCGWWEGSLVSKIVFLAAFAFALIIVLRIIPSHINAAVKARVLEAEKQALKLELQESRISIMLSQMQPHFIFNTLNTIYHLCEIDPDVARSTINSFSQYLRNNIDNLERSEMIHFDKEMSFVKAYLDIEKVRFDDELQITFDTAITNFKLPVLTVQPIVENAVKHGTSKKQGVSSLYISTREADDAYEIVIRDTGAGFDVNHLPDNEHKHIGISSVRQRLTNLCNGTLNIESTVGEGTTATIRIPKKEGQDL